MKSVSVREAKNGFGLIIDTARMEAVQIAMHGRGVVIFTSLREYEMLLVSSGSRCKHFYGMERHGNRVSCLLKGNSPIRTRRPAKG